MRGYIPHPNLAKKLRAKAGAGTHFSNLLAFVNPRVARLDEHDHIFGGIGCWPLREPCKNNPRRYYPVQSKPHASDDADMKAMNVDLDAFSQ